MPEIDEATLELFERRLSDRLTERVRGSLFKLYAAVAVAVGATLGFVGFSIIDGIKQAAEDSIDSKIQVITAKIDAAGTQLAVMESINERAKPMMSQLEAALSDFKPRAEELGNLTKQVADIELRRKQLEASLANIDATVGSLSELGQKFEELAKQVKSLSEIVAANSSRSSITTPSGNVTIADVTRIAGAVASTAQQVNADVQQYNKRTIVFFQFNGMEKDQAQKIAGALRQKGYNVPGEDPEPMPPTGLSEVRYFWPADQSAAEGLASAATAVLNDLQISGGPRPVTTRDNTNWPKTKPKPGTIELWIGLAATNQG